MERTHIGFDSALKAIRAKQAEPHALWVLLREESERDGYAIKPAPWEGPGEYQHVRYFDERGSVFVFLPTDKRLPRVERHSAAA